jgi:hypothetical protein
MRTRPRAIVLRILPKSAEPGMGIEVRLSPWGSKVTAALPIIGSCSFGSAIGDGTKKYIAAKTHSSCLVRMSLLLLGSPVRSLELNLLISSSARRLREARGSKQGPESIRINASDRVCPCLFVGISWFTNAKNTTKRHGQTSYDALILMDSGPCGAGCGIGTLGC